MKNQSNNAGLYPKESQARKDKTHQHWYFEQSQRCQRVFFEMQREQEKTTQRYINIQNRIIEICLQGRSASIDRTSQQLLHAPSIQDEAQLSGTSSTAQDPVLQSIPSMARQNELLPGDNVPEEEKSSRNAKRSGRNKGDPNSSAKNLAADPVRRFVPRPVPVSIEKSSEETGLATQNAILLVGRKMQLNALIEKALSRYNNPIFNIVPGNQTKALKDRCLQVNLASLDAIEQLRALLTTSTQGIAAIFNLTGLTQAYQRKGLLKPLLANTKKSVSDYLQSIPNSEEIDDSLENAKHLFLMLKVFMKDLKQSARGGGAWFVNFSFMDGQFGLKKTKPYSLGQAGSVGLTKAFAKETNLVKVKCIDVDPAASPLYLISRLRQEFDAFDDTVEIGLDGKGRWKIDTVEVKADSAGARAITPDSKSVMLITGGAYGIVAEIAKRLAAQYRSRIIIVGRSAYPAKEPQSTGVLQTSQELRQYLIQKMKSEPSPAKPTEIMRQMNSILKARQMRKNIETMKKSGAVVEYHSLDVRDSDRFGRFIDDIYDRWGRIDGVIHGAGVIEDKFIADKSQESFSRVFDTKVNPAMVLEKKLHTEELKFVFFFSSVAARFGNRGQTDYCAANEILNKLADRLDALWPARVAALNWGPWEAGMVTEELRDFLSTRGYSMIPIDAGVDKFMAELTECDHAASEVLLTRSLKTN